MSAPEDRPNKLQRSNRPQAESADESHRLATTSSKASRSHHQVSGNGPPGERRNTDVPSRKSTKDSAQHTSTTKRSQGSSPDSGGFEKIEKDELDGPNAPTNDVSSPPTTIETGRHPEPQKSESRSATSSKPVTGTTVKMIPPQSEEQKHVRSTPHTAPVGTDANDRSNSRTEMAQKSHQHISYSDKLKGAPEGATAPEPPVHDSNSSRTAEREPPSAQIDPTQVSRAEELHGAEAQTPEAHSANRGATLVRHPSSSSPPSRYGGFASGLTTLLGGRSAPLVEIPKDELRQLRKEAKDGHHYRKEFENLRNEYSRLTVEARAQARYSQSVQYENQRLKERMGSLEHELKSVTKRYEDVKSLSDTRGKELVGAQVFLSKADSLSISDVTQKIHTLNQEIYQAAASLGEFIVRSKEMISAEDSKQDVDHSETLLGPSLAQILRTAAGKSEEPVHPFLVQVTLQAFLINFCTKKIHQWAPQESPTDQFLHTLYHEIRLSSEQAVSGRWRSLTRGQLKLETNTWLHELAAELRGILMAASWEVTSEDHVRSFEGKVEAIFKAVLDVRTAIGEKVTSADLEANVVPPGSPFSKAVMEDEYPGDRREGRPESVIATTGIGLWKVAPSAPSGALAYANVLSPKIVLESTLIAVFEPPPPPVTKPKRTKTSKPDEKLKT